MDKRLKNNSKTVGWIALLTNLSMSCVEVLVLLKVVPYNIIGGVRQFGAKYIAGGNPVW